MAKLHDTRQATQPLHLVGPEDLAAFDTGWLAAHGFEGKDQQLCLLPNGAVLVGMETLSRWSLSGAAEKLRGGSYHLVGEFNAAEASRLALGWAMGGETYKGDNADKLPSLVWPSEADRAWVTSLSGAVLNGRRLINLPTNLLGPAELAAEVRRLAEAHDAAYNEIVGDDLLDQNYPAIHAVGRAAADDRAPRLAHLHWKGPKAAKRIAIVGKGVCFDTGGLDLKPAAAMRTMKKDMGGAAAAITLASCIMALKLPLEIDLWIPAVENSVASNAFRPGDVIDSRAGKTIEIGNTDAEGRLILADAMVRACEENPAQLFDFATLTGAARVAVGTEIAAYFSNDNDLASAVDAGAIEFEDPCWRLPLYQPYAKFLDSQFADINNIGEAGPGPQAGASVAALFLEAFLPSETPPAWAHFDIMAYNPAPRPGRPKGGEPMAALAVLASLMAELED